MIDTTRIREELGYSELVPLDEALRLTIAWERQNPPDENFKWAAPEVLDSATEDAILTSLQPPSL